MREINFVFDVEGSINNIDNMGGMTYRDCNNIDITGAASFVRPKCKATGTDNIILMGSGKEELHARICEILAEFITNDSHGDIN